VRCRLSCSGSHRHPYHHITQRDIDFRYSFKTSHKHGRSVSKTKPSGHFLSGSPPCRRTQVHDIYRKHVNRNSPKGRSSQGLQSVVCEQPVRLLDDLTSTRIIPPLPAGITTALTQHPYGECSRFLSRSYSQLCRECCHWRDLEQDCSLWVREGQDLSGEVWSWRLLRENIRKARTLY